MPLLVRHGHDGHRYITLRITMAILFRSTKIVRDAFTLSKRDIKLSACAIVGIAVGISLFLLFSILPFWLLWKIRRSAGRVCYAPPQPGTIRWDNRLFRNYQEKNQEMIYLHRGRRNSSSNTSSTPGDVEHGPNPYFHPRIAG
jgi:hypothetical protein